MTNPKGRFGIHGGQYIPETLMNAVIELEKAYDHYKNDPEFNRELTALFNDYAGRPSRLYYAEKMTRDLGGAKIYLKREDLNHTGAHKINNVLGQALLAKKMGKTRLIARDWSRTARCGNGHCGGADGHGVRGIYGRRGHHPSGIKCIPDAASGRRSDPGQERYGNLKGRGFRGHERVDKPDL